MAILVVDDSTTIRRIVKRCIDEFGINVLEATNGKEALDILQREADTIQLVILDWCMPGVTGLEVLKTIRANQSYKFIRVMMLTSEADQNFATEALGAGANDYLTKPFDGNMLRSKLQKFLGL